MRFQVLGPLEVWEGGGRLPLGGPKQRLVLAHLLLRANQVVPADRLVDQVWGEEPPDAARSALQAYVSRLRRSLGPGRLQGRPPGYVLRAEPDEVDVLQFEDLVGQARRRAAAEPRARVRLLDDALALWSGPPLADLAAEPSLRPEIARLEELRLAASEERIDALLVLGRHGEVVADLERLAKEHPLRERLWGQRMLGLYRSGRQAEALGAYQQARQILAEELGIDPSPALQRLHEQVLRQDAALELPGEPLRGYRLLEQVGQGAFGTVYRALQSQVGREVAVKSIRPVLANHPEFIRRFEAEAQLVARLEHPHIVPVYDYWRGPDGAHLVMRFLHGGSLKDALASGPLEPEAAGRIIDQVTAALAAAHRQGVVHRDVRPANILFDEEGNAYLTDFGIAKDVTTGELAAREGGAIPLAAYQAPEEIRGEEVTPRTDVYSLGLVLFELLTGRHPFPGPPERLGSDLHEPVPSVRDLRPDLPVGIEEVVGRATAKDPGERFPDAPALAAALHSVLRTTPSRLAPEQAVEPRNPYKGLRPFQEADAPDFFGRAHATQQLLARMAEPGWQSRFVAVVGPSGSGKSSLVRAGLLPALRGGALPGSAGWFVVEMVPGSHPFEELEAALLRIAVNPPSSLIQQLQRDEHGLRWAAERALPAGDAELLLVVDQFEELFTLVEDEAQRTSFLAALHAAVTDPRSRVRVVLTLRADFYDRPLGYPGFGDLLGARTQALTPLSTAELEQAVREPAERVGVALEPRLAAEIVAEVLDQPGTLPLLQHALTELFERRQRAALTLQAYREVGGVAGALTRRAEALYEGLDGAGQAAARQLFLRLLTVGEGGAEDTRRRVLRAELPWLEVGGEAIAAVVEAYGRHRLLAFDRDPLTRGPTVEVAHEALLREWGRLRGWIESAREDLRLHRRLAAAATEWAAADRDPSFLLRGGRLQQFQAWAATGSLTLTGPERHYLEASTAQHHAEVAERQRRAAHQAALERRAVGRLRALVAVLAALALVASGLTAVALAQRAAARRQARTALARELAASAVASLAVDPQRSILLAIQAVNTTREADATVVPEAEEALHRAVQADRTLLTVTRTEHLDTTGGPGEHGGAAFSPDGATVAMPADHNTAKLVNAATGRAVWTFAGHTDRVTDVAFSPDGTRLATASTDHTARVWDVATGRVAAILRGHTGPVVRLAFSPDGRRLATASWDGAARVWAIGSATALTVLHHPGPLAAVAFSPDGTHLAVAGGMRADFLVGEMRIWDLASRRQVLRLRTPPFTTKRLIAVISDVAFSPDGSLLATTGGLGDGTVRLWDAKNGRQVGAPLYQSGIPTLASPLLTVAFSADGKWLAAGGHDEVVLLSVKNRGPIGRAQQVRTLPRATRAANGLAFSPDGTRLAVATSDGTTRVWDLAPQRSRERLLLAAHGQGRWDLALSPDGRRLATIGPDGTGVWDVETGRTLITQPAVNQPLSSLASVHLAVSPDGTRLAAAGLNRPPVVLDATTNRQTRTLPGRPAADLALSPDGSHLATAGPDGTRLWDAASGRTIRTLPDPALRQAVSFSPDGRLLATGGGSDGAIRIWDLATDKQQSVLAYTTSPATSTVLHLTFSPDGRRLAATILNTGAGSSVVPASETDGTVLVWEVETGKQQLTLRQDHPGGIFDAAFSPNGARLATAGLDGTVRLWDSHTGAQLITVTQSDSPVRAVAFSADGRLLASLAEDGIVRFDVVPVEDLIALAHQRVTRGFTDDECRRYLHLDRCPDR
jgi:WD40 repeat protein/DNA-binding SARP family transcriptional activator/energy-coupling factor transporter ATP-binding protein EcfA2